MRRPKGPSIRTIDSQHKNPQTNPLQQLAVANRVTRDFLVHLCDHLIQEIGWEESLKQLNIYVICCWVDTKINLAGLLGMFWMQRWQKPVCPTLQIHQYCCCCFVAHFLVPACCCCQFQPLLVELQ